ncbi:SDR family oxidoreductase [Luteococcus sp. Sow4_B9]|uniref:SDR family oxidoreductase n=1 Tax=Luteococcus sp. Sow4_B9 TaxID=3438792 RepID=UPI003F95BF47
MSKVIIIGAHGKVALQTLPLLAEAGHEVEGLVRAAEQADDIAATGATPVVADVEELEADALAELFRGADVVVWSAGAGGGNPRRTYAVDRDAAIRSMEAALAAGVGRFVMVSYFGAGADHGVSPENSFYAYADAKAAADEYLQASQLDWTILRPSALTHDEPTGRVDDQASESGQVSRGNVARMIAAVVNHPATSRHRIIQFNDGETPVDEVAARA